jgi:mRNA-degrading endonuclease RelE of RelBE toxin-antitoxin system
MSYKILILRRAQKELEQLPSRGYEPPPVAPQVT